METNKCAKCEQELSPGSFNKNDRSKDVSECCHASNKPNTERGALKKVFTNPELSRFTPRQLIDEIKARGYKGTLTYEQVIIL